MPFLIQRLSRLLRARLRGWRLPLAVALLVFLTSWLAMALVEPAGSPIAEPANYWWYFVVTAATVGYGDFSPSSAAGHLVGAVAVAPDADSWAGELALAVHARVPLATLVDLVHAFPTWGEAVLPAVLELAGS